MKKHPKTSLQLVVGNIHRTSLLEKLAIGKKQLQKERQPRIYDCVNEMLEGYDNLNFARSLRGVELSRMKFDEVLEGLEKTEIGVKTWVIRQSNEHGIEGGSLLVDKIDTCFREIENELIDFSSDCDHLVGK